MEIINNPELGCKILAIFILILILYPVIHYLIVMPLINNIQYYWINIKYWFKKKFKRF